MAGSELQQSFPPILENRHPDAPRGADLDKCVHCGLCLNACPTYRELGVEMDSPRGRIYQMVQVATGQAEAGPSYLEHMDLCLGCRACETACPSGVPYGRLIEAARAEIVATRRFPWMERLLRWFVYGKLLPSRAWLKAVGAVLYLIESSGLRLLAEKSGVLSLFGKLGRIEPLAPQAEAPFFFAQYGRTFPAVGEKRARVAMLGGCIANVFFARLNEATVRVLQQNGCEVVIPEKQTCCGALHAHAGEREKARELARRNIDAILPGGFDAIISNTAGCGAALKEYHELLEHDEAYAAKAREFVRLMRDVNEFLCELGLRGELAPLNVTVTYQDSCHLLHGQKIRNAPRELLGRIPGLELRELPFSDICCGSAGVYNVVHDELAASLIEKKMDFINGTGAQVIATANPGCMIQLRAGVKRHGKQQPVKHVVELLDESYRKAAK
jgi:glycolate oxidase iron-sulfur subunit